MLQITRFIINDEGHAFDEEPGFGFAAAILSVFSVRRYLQVVPHMCKSFTCGVINVGRLQTEDYDRNSNRWIAYLQALAGQLLRFKAFFSAVIEYYEQDTELFCGLQLVYNSGYN